MADLIERYKITANLPSVLMNYCNRFNSKQLESITEMIYELENSIESADVQPVNQCKMIPQNPDCRGYTDTFFCTNCQLHIHLGFIGQRYGGNYCIECGAEVEDGDTE